MPTQDIGQVRRAVAGLTNNASGLPTIDPSGALVVIDFFAKAVLDGYGYQVRAGTVTTPLVGDVVITDTAAEYCVDVANGGTLIPMRNNIAIRLGGGTLHEYAVKSVATASSAGTAFVPLLLKSDGVAAARTTARVSAAGGVTVTAETATTTLRHWAWSNPVAVGAGNDLSGELNWEPRRPPRLAGTSSAARCLYVQIAATTTGPSYYASLDYLEIPTALLAT